MPTSPHRTSLRHYEPYRKTSDLEGICESDKEPPVPRSAGNFLTRYRPVSFSRKTLFRVVSYMNKCTGRCAILDKLAGM